MLFSDHNIPSISYSNEEHADTDFQQSLSPWVTDSVKERAHGRKYQGTFPVCPRVQRNYRERLQTLSNRCQSQHFPVPRHNARPMMCVHTDTLLSALKAGWTHTRTLSCMLSRGLQLRLDHFTLLALPRDLPRICAHSIFRNITHCKIKFYIQALPCLFA